MIDLSREAISTVKVWHTGTGDNWEACHTASLHWMQGQDSANDHKPGAYFMGAGSHYLLDNFGKRLLWV